MLETLLDGPTVSSRMGQNGRAFYAANYAWPVIEGKYLSMLDRLARTQLAPAPRRRRCRAGSPGAGGGCRPPRRSWRPYPRGPVRDRAESCE